MATEQKKVNAKNFNPDEELVINCSKIFFQGICVTDMSREQKIALIVSLVSMYSIFREDINLVANVFSDDVYEPFKIIKKNGFYALDGCDENAHDTNVLSKIRLDEKELDEDLLSDMIIEDQYGEDHNILSAPDEVIDYTVSNLMRVFYVYRLVMRKLSGSIDSMREIESNMIMYAIQEKAIDSSYEDDEPVNEVDGKGLPDADNNGEMDVAT